MFRNLLSRKRKDKVTVLGIDGLPCGLLERFVSEGIMPNFAKLVKHGTLLPMSASIPEVSSTSWTTFMTGVNPGRHGIYGFMEISPKDYSWRFPNAGDVGCQTLWDMAGQRGKESVVINIPSTYPARPLNGKLVAGFVALDLQKATYPDSFYSYLKNAEYRLDVDASKAASSMVEFADDIMATFRKRQEVILHVYDNAPCNLFIAAITETDRLHHYLWEALDNSTHPYHGYFIEFYGELDRFIGALADRVPQGAPLIILSDHGFTSIDQEIYLNAFLRSKGHLGFQTAPPSSFQDMTPDSKAFALDPSRIYVHTADRFARGCVQASDYKSVLQSLREDLLGFEVGGRKVIKTIYSREELYHGERADQAPDLICMPHEGFDLKGNIQKENLYGRSLLTGCHTREDATFFINRKIAGGKPHIVDVGPTVLELLNIPTNGLDGNVLI